MDALNGSSAPLDAAHFSKLAAVVHLSALLADHADPKPETLDTLPVDVLNALGLSAETLKATMPASESLSDTSSLHA